MTDKTEEAPASDQVLVSWLKRTDPTVRHERIAEGSGAICWICTWAERAGALITIGYWEAGVPHTRAVFVCDDCFLTMATADQKFIAKHGISA